MRIIPAIDLLNGQCARLEQGQYQKQKIYHKDPLYMAQKFEAHGMKYLHLVDLDGAKKGQLVNWHIIEKIALKTNLKIDFGGGIKTEQDLITAFNSGASQITAGSIAVKNPDMVTTWLKKYGADKIILGADIKDEYISISAWTEKTAIKLWDFLENYKQKGIKQIICTDISKDGMLQGPAFELYQKIQQKFPDLKLIASGGVGQITDIENLKNIQIEGVIIGKALYENKINLKALEKYVS